MKIPIELFLDWQQKNMITYSGTNVSIEYYLLFYKEELSKKNNAKTCFFCEKKFLPYKVGYYDIQIYCSHSCRDKEYAKRARIKYKQKKNESI